MCQLCQSAICPPKCPNYEGERETKGIFCVCCGEEIEQEKGYYRIHGFPYCPSCLAATELDGLIRICEITLRAALEKLGFVYGNG